MINFKALFEGELWMMWLSTIHNKQSNSNYLAHYDIRSTILYKENIYIYMCLVDVTSCLYMYLLITIVLRVIKFDTFIVLFFLQILKEKGQGANPRDIADKIIQHLPQSDYFEKVCTE